ncbi:spore coat U domain-containing protein [Polaromonas sp. P1(28)-8]|nr:spore coat U domain-containing protein [Polaromonas sp. P1(28)-8]
MLTRSGDPTTTTYSLASTNGLYPQGQNNRAYYPTNKYLKYDIYKDASYSSRWGPSGSAPFTGTLNFGSGTSASLTLPYYNRVAAQQSAVAADYTDTMTATLTYSVTSGVNATATPATMPVIITTNPQCQFSTPPGTMSFSYTSFQSTAATGSTQFATRCTSGLPYTMSLGSTSGTLLGLAYSLSLSAASGTGTGAAQTYLVNGNIAANQAGICATSACSASAPPDHHHQLLSRWGRCAGYGLAGQRRRAAVVHRASAGLDTASIPTPIPHRFAPAAVGEYRQLADSLLKTAPGQAKGHQ